MVHPDIKREDVPNGRNLARGGYLQRPSEIYLQAPTWFGAAAGKVRSPGLSIPNPSHENGSSSLSQLLSKQPHPRNHCFPCWHLLKNTQFIATDKESRKMPFLFILGNFNRSANPRVPKCRTVLSRRKSRALWMMFTSHRVAGAIWMLDSLLGTPFGDVTVLHYT